MNKGERLFNRIAEKRGWTVQQQLQELALFCEDRAGSLTDTILEWVQQNDYGDDLYEHLAQIYDDEK